jgi:hypothetical protein
MYDWYQELNDAVGDEISGCFKFYVEQDEKQFFDICWEGLGENLSLTKKSNVPPEILNENYDEIMKLARIESHKAYKEVMMAYVGDPN